MEKRTFTKEEKLEILKEALKQFDVEAGVLAEWDGAAWETARRNQFVEVTGPGGIYGNENPDFNPENAIYGANTQAECDDLFKNDISYRYGS
jgi:transposase-like protein